MQPAQPNARSAQLDNLMKQALGDGDLAQRARSQAQKLLGLDDLNWSYFYALYQSKFSGSKKKGLWIHEEGGQAPEARLRAYPIAIAPQELLGALRLVEYSDLKTSSERYDHTAREAALWVKKMQAGSGSSMTRTTYLARELGIPAEKTKIGAKGTDLLVEVANPSKPRSRVKIPLAEAQILQTVHDIDGAEVGEAFFHDIVSSETEAALASLWSKPTLSQPSRTYSQMVKAHPKLSYFGRSFQSFIPTLDEKGQVSFNRLAPGGHALFALDALRAAYLPNALPETDRPLVAAISNGEDLSGTPDRYIIGYAIKKRAPIILVTTERTAVDAKGGLLSLLRDDDGTICLTVIETAQAKEAGQEKRFSELPGMVSTNLTLFNYQVLAPLITHEVREIGEDAFMRIIAPDLILNLKDQRDPDGVSRKYLQLEGAMGSTIMNLDRYWRKKYGEPMVHIVNVDRMHRTEFFSPIKSAFDYFMQFHSDRFEFDSTTMRLRNLRPGELPQVSLQDPATSDKFYQDVQNVLDCFQGTSIRELDELQIKGQVDLRGLKLIGRVQVVNRSSGKADVREFLSRQGMGTTLQDQSIEL